VEVGSAAAAMPDFDLHQWFRPEELTPCPVCGARAGIRLATTGSFLCLECGHVGAMPAQVPDEQDSDDEARAG
jgi:ribosomal protein L37AE/L43A